MIKKYLSAASLFIAFWLSVFFVACIVREHEPVSSQFWFVDILGSFIIVAGTIAAVSTSVFLSWILVSDRNDI